MTPLDLSAWKALEAKATKVFVVETGDYEQRYVFGVFSSVAAAIAGIKEKFGSPYAVSWDELVQDEHGMRITAHFKAVNHCSVMHDAEFEITEMELDTRTIAPQAIQVIEALHRVLTECACRSEIKPDKPLRDRIEAARALVKR